MKFVSSLAVCPNDSAMAEQSPAALQGAPGFVFFALTHCMIVHACTQTSQFRMLRYLQNFLIVDVHI